MAKDLKNKVAIITGGAQGIGFEIAKRFLKKGAIVAILDIDEELGTEAVKTLNTTYGNKAEFFKCDVTKDLEAVSTEIIDKYKTVDILVNNAGTVDETSIRRTMEVNTIALIEWSMRFWEHMRVDNGGKGGTIINIASVYGFVVDPFEPYYKASKYAVMGFTKTLGHKKNFKKFGVRVVVICPGFTETKLTSNLENLKMIMQEEFMEFTKKNVVWQKADVVGKAAVEVFEKVDSGTAWVVEGGRPIEQV